MSRWLKYAKMAAALREMQSLSQSMVSAAPKLGVSYALVRFVASKYKISFRQGRPAGTYRPTPEAISRAVEMAELYRAGATLKEIGERFGVSRERARQIMARRLGMNAKSGGQHVKAIARARGKSEKRDAKFQRNYGCSYAEYSELKAIGARMIEAGASRYKTPVMAFGVQRRNAAIRGVRWEITLPEWWSVWQSSGKWEHRGRGQGYVMCRYGDAGPYAVGNVFIALAAENSAEGQRNRKTSGLPCGVKKAAFGRFSAQRRINGTTVFCGVFDTADAAHAAYLAAFPQPYEGRA